MLRENGAKNSLISTPRKVICKYILVKTVWANIESLTIINKRSKKHADDDESNRKVR